MSSFQANEPTAAAKSEEGAGLATKAALGGSAGAAAGAPMAVDDDEADGAAACPTGQRAPLGMAL
eukprot:12507588-Alexandrium_andersonii.AAC.1